MSQISFATISVDFLILSFLFERLLTRLHTPQPSLALSHHFSHAWWRPSPKSKIVSVILERLDRIYDLLLQETCIDLILGHNLPLSSITFLLYQETTEDWINVDTRKFW